MIKIWKFSPKLLWILLCIIVSFSLLWCGSTSTTSNKETAININGFELNYKWNINLKSLPIKTDDYEWIVALYQEEWKNLKFRDSLLIAEKYSKYWANAFVHDNLDIFKNYNLTLSNLKKKQIWFNKDWEKINAVLVEYEITEWLVSEIPALYISQLFIPKDNVITLMSFITENSLSRDYASDMFKNIR